MTSTWGIRGAAQARSDSAADIDAATRGLLAEMVSRNGVDPAEIVAIWFTQTPDLTAAHAPASARELGWRDVPLLGAQEVAVDGAMPRVVRVLMLVPAPAGSRAVRHVYLGPTRALREDLNDGGIGE